jgi:hypothetical protein
MRTAPRTRSARSALARCERLLTSIHDELDVEVASAADWEQDSQRGYVAEEHVAALKDVLAAIKTAQVRMEVSKRG